MHIIIAFIKQLSTALHIITIIHIAAVMRNLANVVVIHKQMPQGCRSIQGFQRVTERVSTLQTNVVAFQVQRE